MRTLLPKLCEPGYIGNVRLKNRIIKAPQHTGLTNADGTVSDRMLKYYQEVAQGGVGMVIVEYAYVDEDASRASVCQLSISKMDAMPGLSLLAQTIHANGAKAAIQISHSGRQKFTLAKPIKAASRIPWEEIYFQGCPPPDEITFEEILEVVKAFGQAAKRAEMAEFDMVEIHACHGYLISNFLSPHTNKRTDWYGGSLENRMRFLLEVIAEIKCQVSPSFPISVRVSGTDYEPDGHTIEETIELCKRLEAMGVAVIHMSGGNHHQTIHEVSPMSMSIAHNVWAAEAVKKVLSIPVIASGSITLPELAEEILEQGKGDFIGLGRPLWADPQWPRKVMEGRPEDVRPCIRCNDGCLARGDHQAKTIMCTVNPAICRSEEFKLTRAEKSKKIAVVGGGPAGMEAARVCALRGHEVTLYERRKLGGALLEASVPEFKADIRNLIAYYSTLMGKMNIKVINEEATPQILKKGKYEAVIVAAGSTPIVPNVPGISGPNVTDALKVLNGTAKVGKKVAIIGAGIVGTEVGMYLAEQGKEVVVLEMLDTIMTGITPDEKVAYEQRISKLKMCFQTGKRLESVSGKKITLIDRFGMQSEMTADTIVLACGFRPNREIIDALDASRIKVVDIGDCMRPRKILDAIRDGYTAGKLLD